MALTLYRRHRRDCKAGHQEDLHTSEFDERKKGFRRCECPIIISGSLQKKFKRQSSGRWQWDEAKVISDDLEKAGNWEGYHAPPAEPEAPKTQRISTAFALEAFLARSRNRNNAPATLAKYKTFSNQLSGYCDGKGFVYIDQLTVADMDAFYASWKDGLRAKAKKLDRLKRFSKFCYKRRWITDDLADDLNAPAGSNIVRPKNPFTDEELEEIFKACDQIGPAPGPPRRNWGGEDAKDFIYLSIYTGLRISDVATFDISQRLKGNDVFLRMHKTQRPLFTWIPDWLVERLRARDKRYGSLIFKCGVTHNMKQLTDIWRNKRLAYVFDLAGPFDQTPHPHRFRYTFVRILIDKGVPIPDIAELIGDTEEILRKHYAPWIKPRQERLSRILQEAFEDKPKPNDKVVSIR
jgi:integrase